MATKRTKNNSINNDFDLDAALSFDNFDFNEPLVKDDRKPIVRAATAAFKGAAKAPRDTAFLKRTLKDALPRGFGQSWDAADKVGESLRNLYDESAKEIKPALRESKRVISKLIPRESKLVPKSVTKVLDRWDEDAKREARNRGSSKEREREDSIDRMTEIFRLQQEQAADQRGEDLGKDRLKQGIEMTRHRDLTELLTRSSISMDKLQKYQSSVTLGFQKKSLELQMRQLFAMQDMLLFAKEDAQRRDALLVAISKNTTLPDAVKINSKEAREAMSRNKWNESVHSGLFGGRDKMVEGLLGKVSGAVLSQVRGVAGGLHTGAAMADMSSIGGDMGPPGDKYTSGGGKVGEEIGQALARLGMSKLKGGLTSGKFDKWGGQKILKTSNRLENLHANVNQRVNAFKKSDQFNYDDSMKNGFMRILQGLVPGMGPDLSVSGGGLKNMDAPATPTKRTNRAIEEVIPGFLARIYRELQITRTGNANIELTTYNYGASKFTSKGKAETQIFKEIINGKAVKRTQQQLDSLLNQIDPSGKALSPEARGVLKKKLLQNSTNMDEANKKNLAMYGAYEGENDKLVKEIVPVMDKFFSGMSDDKRVEFSHANNSLAGSIADPREAIQRQADWGNMPYLKKMGFVAKDGKNVDMNKIIEYIVDPANADQVRAIQSAKSTGGAAFQSMTKSLNPQQSIKDRLAGAAGAVKGSLYSASASVMGGVNQFSQMNPSQMASATKSFAVTSMQRGKQAVNDVYVAGEGNPRLLAAKLLAGAYRDRATKSVITSVDQIKGAVEDMTDNNTVVLEAKDLAKLTIVNPVTHALEKVQVQVSAKTSDFMANVPTSMASMTDMLKKQVSATAEAGSQEVSDVYVEGESQPRMLAAKINAGAYVDGESGEAIKHQSNIKGDVKDELGRTVIAVDELPRLRVWHRYRRVLVPIRFVGRLAFGIGKVLWKGQVLGFKASMWNLKMLGKGLAATGKGLKWLASKKPKDVYVRGEAQPRLYAAKMKAGDYRDQESGERINFHDEITGPVIDRDGEIVLSAEDLPNMQVYDNILKIMNPVRLVGKALKLIGKGLWWAAKKWQTKIAPWITKKAFGAIGAVANTTLNWLAQPRDVHVKGEATPRLRKVLMEAGKYFSAKTREVISVPRQIDGAVLDENGEEVISQDEFNRGLTLVDGRPVKGLVNAVGKGFKALNKMMSFRVKLPAGIARTKSTSDLLKDKAVSAGDKTVMLLQDIKQIFEDKFSPKSILGDTNGDGVRDGSWQDRVKKAASMGGGEDKKTEGKDKDKSSAGMMAKLAGLFGKKKKDGEEGEGGMGWKEMLGWGAGGAAGAKALWGARLAKVAAGAKAIGPGIVAAAGGAAVDGGLGAMGVGKNKLDESQDDANWSKMNSLEKLESGFSRGTEKVGQFAFLGNIANQSAKNRIDNETGYMQQRARGEIGKGLLDYILGGTVMGAVNKVGSVIGVNAAKGSAYDTIRFVQYGFEKKNTDARDKADAMEDALMDLVKSGPTVTLDEKKLDPAKLMEPWGLDSKNDKHVELFFGWYKNRFKPVFLTHLNAIKRFTGKADLRAVGGIKKEEVANYVEAIRFANGPYDYRQLPTLGKWAVANGLSVDLTISEALKDLGVKAADGKAATPAANAATVAGTIAAVSADLAPKKEEGAWANFKNKLFGDDKKLPVVAAAVSSTVGKADFGQEKGVNALDAVRFKTYGLKEMDAAKVQSLRTLERLVGKDITYGGDGKASWKDNAIAMMSRVQGAFGITDPMSDDGKKWVGWYMNRFLPTFLAYATSYKNITGKTDVENAAYVLKADQQLQTAKLLVGISGIWAELQSPWPKTLLARDGTCTDDNIQFLENLSKGVQLQEAKAPPKAAAAATSAETQSLWQKTTGAVKNFFSPTKEGANKLAAVTSPDAEAPSKGMTGTSPVAVNVGGAGAVPAVANGDLFDGRNAMSFLNLKGGVKLEGMNPEFMKNFQGMAEEYGKLTGKKIGINDAFRSYADQVDAKKKYGARAAAPGSSLHEFGLAMDIDTKTLDEMDKMGLMRKYGFTRPVGGEGWHMEPIGIQQDIAKFKKDQEAAKGAIASGIGRGGGGFGTISGAPQYSRNRELALSIYQAGGAGVVDNSKKDSTTLAQPQLPGGQTPGQALNAPQGASPMSAGPKLSVDGGTGAAADGETKPTMGGIGGRAGVNPAGPGSFTKAASLPADPSVKVPDPTGSGYTGLKDTIEAAAKMVGVDSATMVKMAAIESSFNPSAKASGSSASGLFQFTKDTWNAMIAKYGSKYGFTSQTPPTDPKAASIMAAHLLKDAEKYVSGKVKRAFGPTEAYLTHFLGQGGAVNFLQALEADPNQIAAQIMPKAAKANVGIFYDANGKPRTLQEVYATLDNKVNTKLSQFGIPNSVAKAAAPAVAGPTAASDGSEQTAAVAPPPAAPGFQKTSFTPGIPSSAAQVADPTAGAAANPLASAYGFQPAQATQRTAPQGQPTQLDASIMAKTEGILEQSLTVQKQMSSFLETMANIMARNGATPAPAAADTSKPSTSEYTVPKAPVQMKRQALV